MNTNEKKLTEDEIAQMGAAILTEVIEQYRQAAENANKVANTFKDVMVKLPFGLVLGIAFGGKSILTQVLGSNTHCEISMDRLRRAMKEDEGVVVGED